MNKNLKIKMKHKPHIFTNIQHCCEHYTGRFIMFFTVTNIYNKKTKGPTLMGLFTATRKLKKKDSFCFDNYECSMCAPRVTRHTSIRYSNSCHTRVNIFFTAAIIRAFSHGLVCRRVLCLLCTKCTLHSNHRLTV